MMKSKHVIFVIVLITILLASILAEEMETAISHVQVFHYIVHYWGTLHAGVEMCFDIETGESTLICEFFNDKNLNSLSEIYKRAEESRSPITRTVSLYNIHYLHQSLRKTQPDRCLLPTNLTIAESEESSVRYGFLFGVSFRNFDGYSTISPESTIPRVYPQAFLNSSEFLPLKPFEKLIRGASYVASDCHKRDSGTVLWRNCTRY
jgi:hypothetical protein